ncbi:7715_t:CDS:1, partial [Entrophospora sp. SA101]
SLLGGKGFWPRIQSILLFGNVIFVNDPDPQAYILESAIFDVNTTGLTFEYPENNEID